jgi:hypothetical protein
MIAYTEVALLAYLQTLFPTWTVIMSPPDLSTKRLTLAAQKAAQTNDQTSGVPLNPQNTIGVPGLTIWNVGEKEDPERFNMVRASKGVPMFLSANLPQYMFMQDIAVKCTWDVKVRTRTLPDMVNTRRTLRYSDKYVKLGVTFPVGFLGNDSEGNPLTTVFPLRFKINDDFQFSQQEDKDGSAKIEYYGLDLSITVDTNWLISNIVPQILSVFVDFYVGISEGNQIPPSLIDQFSFTTLS